MPDLGLPVFVASSDCRRFDAVENIGARLDDGDEMAAMDALALEHLKVIDGGKWTSPLNGLDQGGDIDVVIPIPMRNIAV